MTDDSAPISRRDATISAAGAVAASRVASTAPA